MFLWLIGEMIIASWLWHLIYLMSSLASSPSSNLPFTVFCGNYWRVDALGAILKLAPFFNDCDVEATIDVHLQFATSRHILPFLRCKLLIAFTGGKIWVKFNYFWISVPLLDAGTVKWYKKTHLAQNEGCNNSTKGYEMKFSIWHCFSQIHL